MYVRAHMYMHMCIRVCSAMHTREWVKGTIRQVCMHVCIYCIICMYVHAYIFECMYAFTALYMYRYVCMYVYYYVCQLVNSAYL